MEESNVWESQSIWEMDAEIDRKVRAMDQFWSMNSKEHDMNPQLYSVSYYVVSCVPNFGIEASLWFNQMWLVSSSVKVSEGKRSPDARRWCLQDFYDRVVFASSAVGVNEASPAQKHFVCSQCNTDLGQTSYLHACSENLATFGLDRCGPQKK